MLKDILSKIRSDKNIKRLFPDIQLNSVLCNLYAYEKDKMGWHADDEPELGDEKRVQKKLIQKSLKIIKELLKNY